MVTYLRPASSAMATVSGRERPWRLLGYRIKSNSFLLRLAQLIDPPRRAYPDLNSICLELAVLGLAGVGGHCDRLVADVFHLINRLGVSDRAAGT